MTDYERALDVAARILTWNATHDPALEYENRQALRALGLLEYRMRLVEFADGRTIQGTWDEPTEAGLAAGLKPTIELKPGDRATAY